MTRKQILAILGLIGDAGWEAICERAEQRTTAWHKALLDPSRERKDKFPDDYLRGQIEALEWFIAFPSSLERSDDQANEEERAQRRKRESADLIARLGATYPGVASASQEV